MPTASDTKAPLDRSTLHLEVPAPLIHPTLFRLFGIRSDHHAMSLAHHAILLVVSSNTSSCCSTPSWKRGNCSCPCQHPHQHKRISITSGCHQAHMGGEGGEHALPVAREGEPYLSHTIDLAPSTVTRRAYYELLSQPHSFIPGGRTHLSWADMT